MLRDKVAVIFVCVATPQAGFGPAQRNVRSRPMVSQVRIEML